jgi:hypothetical protein
VNSYKAQLKEESGFALLAEDETRLVKNCSRTCAYECAKPGRAFDFVIPYRK